MEQLVYQSRAGDDFTHGDVFEIIRTSARRNLDRGITGFLLFKDDRFLQLIEGERSDLDTLLEDLKLENRHCDLEILQRRPIAERRFEHWVMKRIVANMSASDLRMVKQSLAEADPLHSLFEDFLEVEVCAKAGLVQDRLG